MPIPFKWYVICGWLSTELLLYRFVRLLHGPLPTPFLRPTGGIPLNSSMHFLVAEFYRQQYNWLHSTFIFYIPLGIAFECSKFNICVLQQHRKENEFTVIKINFLITFVGDTATTYYVFSLGVAVVVPMGTHVVGCSHYKLYPFSIFYSTSPTAFCTKLV